MVMKKIFLFLSIVLLINFISASFEVSNHSIDKIYSINEPLVGWVNISLNNEPVTAVLKSSISNSEHSFNLFDLINANTNYKYNYTCTPNDCNPDYILTDNGESQKILSMSAGSSETIGFKITTPQLITDVNSFSIKISSNNAESTSLPLSADVLNDGEIEWYANKGSGNYADKNSGCYVETDAVASPAGVVDTPYCEKITLHKAPSVKIGANLLGSAANIPFTFSISDVNGTQTKTCSASASGNGEVSCTPSSFSVNDGDYFVCIKAQKRTDNNKYSIKYEQKDSCGFTGTFLGSYGYDFDIFAESETYSASQTTTLNNDAIKNEIVSYLSSRYSNNCSTGCVIPIKISSGAAQTVSITEPSLSYFAGISTSEITLYNLEETPAKLNAGFQKLFLDEGNFKVPNSVGNYTASISLDNDELFSEKISVENGPQIKFLYPMSTAVNFPTTFKIYLNGTGFNITKYQWDFGDGANATSTIDEAAHTYTTEGNYFVNVRITSSDGVSSAKNFEVIILPASEIVPTLLQNTKTNIDNIKSQISNFSEFEQKSLEYSLKLNDSESIVDGLMSSISDSTSETEYESMLGQLLQIRLPSRIVKTISTDKILFYPLPENIDLFALKEISAEQYNGENEEAYKNAVLGWEEENVDTNLFYSQFSGLFDDHEETVLSTFDITFSKKSGDAGNPYLLIKDMNNLFFSQDYSQQDNFGYNSLTLENPETNILFSTTDDVNFENLPMFVSPKISELPVSENITPFTPSSNKWIWFIIIAIIVIIVGIGTWILIRYWYKRRYENYLFKNRNNLYNLVTYIESEKKRGMSEKEISASLRKTGWSSEQISYALKKHAGKKIV